MLRRVCKMMTEITSINQFHYKKGGHGSGSTNGDSERIGACPVARVYNICKYSMFSSRLIFLMF